MASEDAQTKSTSYLLPVEDTQVLLRDEMRATRFALEYAKAELSLRDWGIRLDEALFLGGRAKGPFLEAFGADIFFDDSEHNIASARDQAAALRACWHLWVAL